MEFLKFKRLSKGFTQKKLAKEVGVTQSAYCAYERGERKPSPQVHVKLAAALDVDPEEFTAKLYRMSDSQWK